jgi:hypothetical protein
MAYSITVESGLVRAELVGRETVEETKEFLRAVAGYSAIHSAFLIRIAASKPMFRLEQAGLIECFREVACTPEHKIALLADTNDLRVSHEYLELIAHQHALNARSFRSVDEALKWLRQPPPELAPEPLKTEEQAPPEPPGRRREVHRNRLRPRGRDEKIG